LNDIAENMTGALHMGKYGPEFDGFDLVTVTVTKPCFENSIF
jgi:hypothetical protein